jgi:hypothetical protein
MAEQDYLYDDTAFAGSPSHAANNRTQVSEYDFGNTSGSKGSLIRKTITAYQAIRETTRRRIFNPRGSVAIF